MLLRGVPQSATTAEQASATSQMCGLIQEVVEALHGLAQRCLDAERRDDAV